MSNNTADAKLLERRGFLKGSALFAAAFALAAAAPAAAQDGQTQPVPAENARDEAPKKEDEKKPKPLLDKDGREYRVCDMCGANMYKQEKTWTCEQCGYSYEE